MLYFSYFSIAAVKSSQLANFIEFIRFEGSSHFEDLVLESIVEKLIFLSF